MESRSPRRRLRRRLRISLAGGAYGFGRDLNAVASGDRFRGGHDIAWARRLHFRDHPRDLMHGCTQQAVRPVSGQQFIENHAERIDVGLRGDRRAVHLLGARVLRGHHARQR